MIRRRVQFAANSSLSVAAQNRQRWWILFATLAAILWMNLATNASGSTRKVADDDGEPVVVDENLTVISEDEFDLMVLGRGHDAADRVRQRMREAVQHEIKIIDRHCSLTPEQQAKLELAGRGDIARCFERLAELRRKATAAPLTLSENQSLWMSLEPLRWAMSQGLFNETSLFWKTLQRKLTAEQRIQFRKLEQERGLKILEKHCQYLETTTLTKLSGDCRRKFEELLADTVRSMELTGPNTSYVWLEAAKFQDEFQPLMRERQWRVLQKAIADAKRSEQSLRKYDRWPYDVLVGNEDADNEKKELQP